MTNSFKILESMPDAVLCVDGTAKIIYANPQAELLFGYTKPQLEGQLVHVLLPEAIREKHGEHFVRYMQDPRMRAMNDGREFEAQKRDGSTFPAEINLSPIQTDDGTIVMAVIRRKK